MPSLDDQTLAVGRAAARAHAEGLAQRAGDAAEPVAGDGVNGPRLELVHSGVVRLLEGLDAEERTELAQAVLRASSDICARQTDDVRRRLPSSEGLDDVAVLDDLPRVLATIAQVIDPDLAYDPDEPPRPPEAYVPADGDFEPDALTAEERLRSSGCSHAAARWGQGFTTGELSQEHAMFRLNVMFGLRAALGRRPTAAESDALFAVVDEMSVAASVSFAAMREHRARLEAEAMSQFLSSLAHDLRGGLSGSMMTLDLIAAELGAGDLDARRAGELSEDVAQGRQLLDATLNTMTRVLEAERMRAGIGAVQLRPRRMSLAALVGGVTRAAERAAGGKQAELRIECPPNLVVHTDPDLLTSVLLNFLGNAIRHAGDYGPINVFCRDAGDGQCAIDVRDDGPGIADDKLRHLFDRFHRGGRPDGEGLGLGLFIARSAADLLGAKVEVQSRVGEGSTFTITLPARPPVA